MLKNKLKNYNKIISHLFLLLFLFFYFFGFAQKKDSIVNKKNVFTKSFYVEPGTYGTKRENIPPNYVRSINYIGLDKKNIYNFIDIGIDQRTRLEYRKNDIRRPESINEDAPLLLRTRVYLGVKDVFKYFNGVIEFQDSRRNNGKYPLDDRDVNTQELVQSYVELKFKDILPKDAFGNKTPISFKYGNMLLEYLDRRLIAGNLWRNTVGILNGYVAQFGHEKNSFQLDILYVQPRTRLIDKPDTTNKNVRYFSTIAHFRKWSKYITIEPYYIQLIQDATPATKNIYRDIKSVGIRLYGVLNPANINYEITYTKQFGEENNASLGVGKLEQNAFAYTAELGYTFQHIKTKPKLSAFYAFVSGDKDSKDNKSNRFERYLGFGRPWSADDYLIMENIITPKIKFEFEPVNGLKIDGGFSQYFLASNTDRFYNLFNNVSNNRDITGQSGDYIGQGFDCRGLFKISKFIGANIGYSYFELGDFIKKRQFIANKISAESSHFIYIELNINILDIFKK